MTRAEIRERQARILADYAAGKSNRQIAAEYGVHRSYPPILARQKGAPLKQPPAESQAPWPKPYQASKAAK